MNTFLFRLLGSFQASSFAPGVVRRTVLTAMGVKVADTALIYEGTFFGSDQITIGAGSFISVRCILDGSGPITIGENVSIAPGVQVVTGSHEFGGPKKRAGANLAKPVIIGAGAWIGAGCIILPGVTVGAGCIIGAGSLVTKSTEPNTLWIGSPARMVQNLDA